MKNPTNILIGIVLVAGFNFHSCKKDEAGNEPCMQPVSVNLGTDRVIQEGMTTTLDAGNPGATYLWSTGATTQSIEVSETGIYWVKVSSCSHTASDTVNVELNHPVVEMTTEFGNLMIWLYRQTPLHKANYLSLTGEGFYDGLLFHRVIENFVIQGGDPDGTGFGGPGYTIPAEIIPGLDHVYGAVGAARLDDNINPEKESNGSQFYIVCNPNGRPDLNGNFTVFGIVFSGLETVLAISQVPVDTNQRPIEDVSMDQLSIHYYTASELKNDYGFVVPEK